MRAQTWPVPLRVSRPGKWNGPREPDQRRGPHWRFCCLRRNHAVTNRVVGWAFPNESASRVWRMHDCLRSSRARFNSSAGYFLMRDHGCFVIGCRDRVKRRIRDCPWSVVDARDSAKVVDQVRLLARTLTDVDVTRCGGGLQSRIQWVRLPPASLWIESIDGVVPAAGGAPAGVCSDCSEHGF